MQSISSRALAGQPLQVSAQRRVAAAAVRAPVKVMAYVEGKEAAPPALAKVSDAGRRRCTAAATPAACSAPAVCWRRELMCVSVRRERDRRRSKCASASTDSAASVGCLLLGAKGRNTCAWGWAPAAHACRHRHQRLPGSPTSPTLLRRHAGRLVLRAAMMHPGIEVVAVNDPFVDAGA